MSTTVRARHFTQQEEEPECGLYRTNSVQKVEEYFELLMHTSSNRHVRTGIQKEPIRWGSVGRGRARSKKKKRGILDCQRNYQLHTPAMHVCKSRWVCGMGVEDDKGNGRARGWREHFDLLMNTWYVIYPPRC